MKGEQKFLGQVKFLGHMCDVFASAYVSNERTAIRLVGASDDEWAGEFVATASTNLTDAPCPADHCYIKDWSENAGIEHALRKAGIISEPVGFAPAGHVEANLVKITE